MSLLDRINNGEREGILEEMLKISDYQDSPARTLLALAEINGLWTPNKHIFFETFNSPDSTKFHRSKEHITKINEKLRLILLDILNKDKKRYFMTKDDIIEAFTLLNPDADKQTIELLYSNIG